MKKRDWHYNLARYEACSEAVEWAAPFKTFTAAWDTCERGDWMLWLAARAGVDRELIVLAACACARTALKYVAKDETRPRIAIETAERWTKGKASMEEVIEARKAATAADDDATAAAYAAYAADAAYTAAYAAGDAAAAADAADAAADAAYTAAYAYAADAAGDAARKRTFKKCAALVRMTISARRIEIAMKGGQACQS